MVKPIVQDNAKPQDLSRSGIKKRTRKRIYANGFKKKHGTKAEVWHGMAESTVGGVKKEGLIKNKYGRIVFTSKADAARKNQNLAKAGYGYRKDHIFGAVYNGVPIPISLKKKKK